MRIFLAGVLALLLSGSLLSTPTYGQPQDSGAAQPEIHVFNYGQINLSCQRWSDGCRTCTREGCSNIGPACQPKEVKCIAPPDLKDIKEKGQ